jgi:hypothetical protein
MRDLPPDWKPTAENINALPEPLRRYIHDIETNCDPQGIIRENFTLRTENKFLRMECERLANGSCSSEGVAIETREK